MGKPDKQRQQQPRDHLIHLVGVLIGHYLTISHLNIDESSPGRSRGDYSPIFTLPEATNCFNIITLMIIRENKIIDQFPTRKHKKIWLPF